VMRAISDEPVPRPSGPLPIPPALEEIVMMALERAPEDRFQDAHELALLLDRFAFRSAGFDPAELVARIRRLFPADFAGWKATAAVAQTGEGQGGWKATATPRSLVAVETGQHTMPLHKRVELEGWNEDPPETGHGRDAPTVLGKHAGARPRWRGPASRRTRVYGLLLAALAGVVSATLFVRFRARTVAPPVIAEPGSQAAGVAPVLQPIAPAAVPGPPPSTVPLDTVTEPPTPAALPPLVPVAAPAINAPSSLAGPAPRGSPRQRAGGVVRVAKPAAQKRAISHRTPAAVKPQAAPHPTDGSEAKPTKISPPTRPWSDPFE
jgi:hypothetical protein